MNPTKARDMQFASHAPNKLAQEEIKDIEVFMYMEEQNFFIESVHNEEGERFYWYKAWAVL